MNRQKAYLYFLAFLVIFAFTFREVGGIVGKTYGVSILPESLNWIKDVDRFIFFFSDRGGHVYSIINWTFILGGFLVVGLLRTLKRIEAPDLTSFEDKIVPEGKNPFLFAVPEWRKEVQKK